MEKAAKGLIAHFSIYRGLPKGIYVLFVAQIINAVGNLIYPFLTFFLTQRLGYGSATAGMFILFLSVAYVPGSLIGGKLADVIGRKKVLVGTQGMAALAFVLCAFLGNSPIVPWLLIVSHFFFGAANPTHEAITADMTSGEQRQSAFSLLYFIHSLWLFVLSTVVWTLGEILQATNTNVYIANHTPISHRGRFNSILPIIIGTGFALGPPVMGQYVEAVSVRAVWPLAAGISLFGAAALVLLYMKEKQHRRVEDGQAPLL
jgi:MFS family permease